MPGVISATVGYTGGDLVDPTYEMVCMGQTCHYEAILLEFDPDVCQYASILKNFWYHINPTQGDGQFMDGLPYRTAIFYRDEYQKTLALDTRRWPML